jgi:hypothetical protein
MGLTQEQIDALLTLDKNKRRGRHKGPAIIERNYENWFKMPHRLILQDGSEEQPKCDNEKCIDPRPGEAQVTVTLMNKQMCRYCFLDGWLAEATEGQLNIETLMPSED